jgi:hypothetical protein
MHKSAIERFVLLANEVITELESAIEKYGSDSREYPCADIALKNVRQWRDSALAGILASSYHPNFGISKADLMFGKVEDRMYQLEKLYIDEIRDSRGNRSPRTS